MLHTKLIYLTNSQCKRLRKWLRWKSFHDFYHVLPKTMLFIPIFILGHYIPEAYSFTVIHLSGCLNFSRYLTAGHIIGYEKNGVHTQPHYYTN